MSDKKLVANNYLTTIRFRNIKFLKFYFKSFQASTWADPIKVPLTSHTLHGLKLRLALAKLYLDFLAFSEVQISKIDWLFKFPKIFFLPQS